MLCRLILVQNVNINITLEIDTLVIVILQLEFVINAKKSINAELLCYQIQTKKLEIMNKTAQNFLLIS